MAHSVASDRSENPGLLPQLKSWFCVSGVLTNVNFFIYEKSASSVFSLQTDTGLYIVEKRSIFRATWTSPPGAQAGWRWDKSGKEVASVCNTRPCVLRVQGLGEGVNPESSGCLPSHFHLFYVKQQAAALYQGLQCQALLSGPLDLVRQSNSPAPPHPTPHTQTHRG